MERSSLSPSEIFAMKCQWRPKSFSLPQLAETSVLVFKRTGKGELPFQDQPARPRRSLMLRTVPQRPARSGKDSWGEQVLAAVRASQTTPPRRGGMEGGPAELGAEPGCSSVPVRFCLPARWRAERSGTWRSAAGHAAARTYTGRCCACAACAPSPHPPYLPPHPLYFPSFFFSSFLLLCHLGHGEAERGDAAVPVPGALQGADRGERARAAGPGRARPAGGILCCCLPWGSVLACSGEGPDRGGVSFGRPAGGNRQGQRIPGDARESSGHARESPWGRLVGRRPIAVRQQHPQRLCSLCSPGMRLKSN